VYLLFRQNSWCETSEEWIRFYFFRQDLQDLRDFFRLRRGALSAEGRSIPMILLILSNFLLKMRIHSYFCRISIFTFLRFFFDQTGFFLAGGRAYLKLRQNGAVFDR
jgi:hypothetical protein